MIVHLLRLFILFARNVYGTINKPYITFRKLAETEKDFWQVIYIYIVIFSYFGLVSLARAGLRNPFLLTMEFNILIFGGLSGFAAVILLVYLFAMIYKVHTKITAIILLWSYTLLPTLIWFFGTTILYILLPPPRTLTVQGKIYSIIYIAFSIGLLYWKVILYYLTLRFALRIDLFRIILSSVFIWAYTFLYALIMYRLGIFRIPFI